MSVGSIGTYSATNGIRAYQAAQKTTISTENNTVKPEVQLKKDNVTISDEAREAAIQNKKESIKLPEYAQSRLERIGFSDDDIEKYINMLQEKQQYNDPKEALKSLSQTERDFFNKASTYGSPLTDEHIDSMSREGAHNLLVTDHTEFVDLNNDGMVDRGQGRGSIFPPPNAPQSVKDAWDKTMEGKSDIEKLSAASIFLVMSGNANLKYDSSGNFTGFYGPDDPEYTNIFPTSKEGWFTLLDNADEYIDLKEKFAQSAQDIASAKKYRKMISDFRGHLEA